MRLGKLASRLARNEGFCRCVYSDTGRLRNGNLCSKQLVSVVARPVKHPVPTKNQGGLSQAQRYMYILYILPGVRLDK